VSLIRNALAITFLLSSPTAAKTLLVGNGRDYKLPSEALADAHDGDHITIDPGEYFDCAIVRNNDLTITGDNLSVLTDKVCEEKAILVLRGNNTTIRNLTLQRARVPDGNGAGIRLESPDLTIDHVHFNNNQVGILSGVSGGRININDSQFEHGGVGGVEAKYAVMIGQSTLLRIANCTFANLKGGEIRTAADRSVLIENTIALGDADAAYAVLVTRGTLLMERNTITIGPLVPGFNSAIGIWDETSATLQHNRMLNNTNTAFALVKDWTYNSPDLRNNYLNDSDTLISSSGLWRHRAATQYYLYKDKAHTLASALKRLLKEVLGRQ